MRKILVVLVIAAMVFAFLPPTIGGVNGSVEYIPDGGNTEPVKILAIWETNGDEYTLDDDYYSPGCQIDPPLEYDEYKEVWVYVAVLDLNDPPEITDTDQVKIDISWPENDIPGRPDLGEGGQASGVV